MFAYPALLILLLAGYLPLIAVTSLRYRQASVNGWRLLLEALIRGSPARLEPERAHDFTVDCRYADIESVRRFDGDLFKEFEKLKLAQPVKHQPAVVHPDGHVPA